MHSSLPSGSPSLTSLPQPAPDPPRRGHGEASPGQSPANPKRPSQRPRLLLLAKLTVAASLLGWLVGSGQLEVARLGQVPLGAEAGVFLLLLLGSLALPVVRWWWLLRIQGVPQPLWKILALTWAGYFAALVLPGAASGDLAKSYLILRQQPQTRARAFSTVLADRLIGLHSLLLLGCVALLGLASRGELRPPLWAMGASTLGLWLGLTLAPAAVFCRPAGNRLLCQLPAAWQTAWRESLDCYRSGKLGLLGCFGLSLVSNTMTIACFALSASLLGYTLPWDLTFLTGPLVVLANCLPLTPGGVGLAEATSSGLFATFGVPCGAEMMLLLRIGGAVLALPGIFGLLLAARSRARDQSTGELLIPAGKSARIQDKQTSTALGAPEGNA